MARRLLNLLTSLSLLLCLAVVALWVRSGWSFDTLSYSGRASAAGQRGASISSHRGTVQIEWYVWSTPMTACEPDVRLSRRPIDRSNEPGFIENSDAVGALGLWFVRRTQPFKPAPGQRVEYRVWDVFIPYRFLLPAALAMPLLRGVKWWRRRGRRPGLCPRCGYDLRATPGRCPECGDELLEGPA